MIFAQRHVERTDVDDKYDGGHFVKALDPLASLIALSAHVEYVKVYFFHLKFRLRYGCGQNLKMQINFRKCGAKKFDIKKKIKLHDNVIYLVRRAGIQVSVWFECDRESRARCQ